ncbi:MAG: glycosyltransferase family 2 protein [Thermoleophilaceae bacterium]
MTALGCVVLTTGRRPDELRRALDSLRQQEGVDTDIVVVGNGWEPSGLPAGIRGVGLAEDRGIPAGRNAGVVHTSGELLFFLDDDASLAESDALAQVAARFASEPGLGLAQLRVIARDGGRAARDRVPRVSVGDPARGSEVTAIWEGAVAMRRALFEQVGGWPEEFRFVHEGVDLAWRVMDAGYRVEYLGAPAVLHPEPAAVPARHGYSLYYGMRNKVWLARRHLPLPLGVVYALSFALRRGIGVRSAGDARALAKGLRDGVRQPCGDRKRLRARTLWRMTRAGRPPLI